MLGALLYRSISDAVKEELRGRSAEHASSSVARSSSCVPDAPLTTAEDARYRKTPSGFSNSLSELCTQGLINSPKKRRIITHEGREVVGPTEPLPAVWALRHYWLPRLGKCEAALLKSIFYARIIPREDLSEKTSYSIVTSGFSSGISGLRVLDLVHGPSAGDLTIADVFVEGASS
jgi:hypothetical protein